jgi:hypothetical protein
LVGGARLCCRRRATEMKGVHAPHDEGCHARTAHPTRVPYQGKRAATRRRGRRGYPTVTKEGLPEELRHCRRGVGVGVRRYEPGRRCYMESFM